MNKPIRVLHLEDSKFDAEITKRELQISHIRFDHLWVTNEDDFSKALKDFSPDIVLSDHSLPSFSSFHALKMLKEMEISIPFILFTGDISKEFTTSIIQEGASGYLEKDQIRHLPDTIVETLKKWHNNNESSGQNVF